MGSRYGVGPGDPGLILVCGSLRFLHRRIRNAALNVKKAHHRVPTLWGQTMDQPEKIHWLSGAIHV